MTVRARITEKTGPKQAMGSPIMQDTMSATYVKNFATYKLLIPSISHEKIGFISCNFHLCKQIQAAYVV